MEPLGRFPRVLNGVTRDNIEGPPRDFLRRSPSEILRGTFNILPRDPISTCGTSQGGPFTIKALRVSHRFSFLPVLVLATGACTGADTAHAPCGRARHRRFGPQ